MSFNNQQTKNQAIKKYKKDFDSYKKMFKHIISKNIEKSISNK